MTSLPATRIMFVTGALSAGLSVLLGAFAAHALKQHLSPEMLVIFETGVRYQALHAIALMATAWASTTWQTKGGTAYTFAGWCFVAGTALFSGSLYVLSLSEMRWLGAITPFGGVAFVVGWALLARAVWINK